MSSIDPKRKTRYFKSICRDLQNMGVAGDLFKHLATEIKEAFQHMNDEQLIRRYSRKIKKNMRNYEN